MGDAIQNAVVIDYEEIPHFPKSTVEGHRGRLIFGHISEIPVICMQGRFHYYEGYPLATCVMPVRVMKLLGITHLIASNAAGGINTNFKVGDIMLIKDHLNFMGMAGVSPLLGSHDSRWGQRFVPVTNTYDVLILESIKEKCKILGIDNNIQEGVYTCLGGPNFESIADNRALKILGVDAVGMSTIHEVIVATQCGIKCVAFSLISNMSPTVYGSNLETKSDEVLEIGKAKEKLLVLLVENIVAIMAKHHN